MRLDHPRLTTHLIDDQEKLLGCLELFSKHEFIAIDAERASGFRYSQRAYLIQIGLRDESILLIDPEGISDFQPLAEVINQKTWLLHAATQDLPCLAELGLRPTKLIDTELSARLAGLERVGLGSVCESLLDIQLAKEHSAADWSKRPLPQEMLDYAALDVDVMFELWDALQNLLEDQQKLDWAHQEFDHLLTFTPKAPLAEPWRGLPGITRLRDQNKVKIAASLYMVRDQLAIERDIAPGRLIPDRSIMVAANQAPKSKSELASNPEFQGRASRSMLQVWWQAIQEAPQLEISTEATERPGTIPNHKSWERRFPEAHLRLDIVRPMIQAKAAELHLPVENLLTPDYLRRVCFEPQQDVALQLASYSARAWQIELVTAVIEEGLALATNSQPASHEEL